MGNTHANRIGYRGWLAFLLLMAAQAFSQTTLKIHLHSPWAADPTRNQPPAFIEMVGSGAPIPFRDNVMQPEGADWYVAAITYTGTQQENRHHSWSFVNYIPNANFKWSAESKYAKDGTTGGPNFNLGEVFFDPKLTEVWIIPQGAGKPPIIQDYPPAKKVLMFYNPWPMGAPMIRQGAAAGYAAMRLPDPRGANRCGWYVHYFTDSAYTVHFRHIRTGETYGMAGLKDAGVINLANAFKTADTVYVMPEFSTTGPARITGVYPGKTGTCGYNMGVTVRDFSNSHPDFNKAFGAPGFPNLPDRVVKGMVEPVLGADNKPKFLLAPKAHPLMSATQTWFNTDSAAPAATRNYQTCRDLPVSKDKDGYFTFSSIESPSKSFFPIDDFNRHGDPGFTNCVDKDYVGGGCDFGLGDNKPHNFLFCLEMHAEFTYEKGQTFAFIGDDDVWVFINKKLAIDLGGTHSPARDSIILDAQGLVEGRKYPFDLFYCERQRNGSNLYIRTSIYFEQKSAVNAVKVVQPDGSVIYTIKEEITEGGAHCGATGPSTKVVDAPSKFTLHGPSVDPAQVIAPGTHYQGITIGSSLTQVTIDTAKIKGLKPGTYTLSFVSNATGQGNSLAFTVPVTLLPQVETPKASVPSDSRTTLEPPVVVTLSSATPGATILYTIDGTNPDTVAGGATRLHVPGTTVLSFTTTVTLKAIGVKTEHIPSLIMTETYTRVGPPTAATPVATPAGRRFIEPLTVTLETLTPGATILYTTDGSTPDSVAGGATKAYAGPLTLNATTVLKAIAVIPTMNRSGMLTETYTYAPPVSAKGGSVHDNDGDGRIETVNVDFSGPITILPERMVLKIQGSDGQVHERTVTKAKNELILAAGPGTRVAVNLSTPLPFGVTSVNAAGSAGQVFRQEDIPLLDGTFPLADSAGPVIVKAEVFPVDSLNPVKRVVLTFSEPVLSPTAVAFKREGGEIAAGRVVIARAEPSGASGLILFIDSTTSIFPIVGDSVALVADGVAETARVKDAMGNAPKRKLFRVLEGVVPKATPPRVYVTFADGSNTAGPGSRPGMEATSPPDVFFIPVDARAAALPGNAADGKCPGCFAGNEGYFVGPVVHLEIPGPSTFDLKIFNNLGEFVGAGKGAITESDLGLLTPIQGGTKYLARIVWTGRTAAGRKAGTGAYVLSAVVKTGKDMKSGAPAAVETRRIRFGLLRAQNGS